MTLSAFLICQDRGRIGRPVPIRRRRHRAGVSGEADERGLAPVSLRRPIRRAALFILSSNAAEEVITAPLHQAASRLQNYRMSSRRLTDHSNDRLRFIDGRVQARFIHRRLFAD
jgi:hypothetical protein